MTLPRSTLISLADTPYYHIISRCVRRAFLCGFDAFSGESFEHRRQWIMDEIIALNDTFTINIAAFAIMSNHYHMVIRVDKDRALALSDKEVALHWQTRFSLPGFVRRWVAGSSVSKAELLLIKGFIGLWRARLYDISWYMRCLNETIARRANKEDNCTGHFWQARFKSQALLDERAVLQCMAYVDLNPIRAAMASSLKDSDYTSAQQRIQGIAATENNTAVSLMPMSARYAQINNNNDTIAFDLQDYLALLDWTSRAVLANKRGFVGENTPALLDQLGINANQWIKHTAFSHRRFYKAIGTPERMQELLKKLKQRSLFGTKACEELFT